MKLPSLDEFSALVADIHQAAMDQMQWSGVLQRIAALFEAPTITTWLQDSSGRRDSIRFMNADRVNASYSDYRVRPYALLPAAVTAPVSTVPTNAKVMTRTEFFHHEFRNDFARPGGMAHCIDVRLFDWSGISGFVSVTNQLGAEPFGADAFRIMRLLEPHLRLALQAQFRLKAAGAARAATLELLDRLSQAMLVVDARMRLLHANAAAEQALGAPGQSVLTLSGQRLTVSTPRDASALHRLVSNAAGTAGAASFRGGLLRVESASGQPLFLSVMPLPKDHPWSITPEPTALILVGDPCRPGPTSVAAGLHALYDLTPMETAVAARIGQAETPEAAADALNIRLSTLRSHLQRVFHKTGTTRQAELVRLVGQLGMIAGSCREIG